MKNINILIRLLVSCFFITSCKESKMSDIFYFSKYDKNGNIMEKNAIKLSVKYVNDSIKLVHLFRKDSVVLKFDELENSKGVFRKFSDKFRSYYSFDSTQNGGTVNIFPPFVNKETWLVDKKKIKRSNQEYTIFHFEEMSYCTPSISTYWIKDTGLIAVIFYDGKIESFYLCDSVNGNSQKQSLIEELKNVMVKDKKFFKRAKYLPCGL